MYNKNASEPMWFRGVAASMGLYFNLGAVLEGHPADFHDDCGQVLYQSHEQLNTGHDDLVDVPDQGVHNPGDDLRDRLNDSRNDLRQGLNQ